MQEDSLKKRYFYKLFSSGFNAVANIVFLALVPSALGPAAYGQFTYLQQFFTQIVNFLDAGTSIAFFTKISANHKREELISMYSLYSLLLLVVLLVVFFVIDSLSFTSAILPGIEPEYVNLGILFAFLTWLSQILIKVSDAYALTVSVELVKIAVKLLSIVALYYMVNYLYLDIVRYFYFHNLFLLIFLLLTGFILIKKKVLSRQFLTAKMAIKKTIREFYKFCSPLFVYNLVGLLVGIFDIWLLQKMSGSVQTGFYGLALSIVAISFLFTSSMTPLITREFSKSFAENDLLKVRNVFSKYIPVFYTISAFLGVFIAFQVDNVLEIFTDERFYEAYWVLVVMAFYPLHQTYGQLSGAVFYANEETKLYRNIGIFSMMAGLIVSIILIYYYELGALGLAFKMLITQIIGVSIQLYFNCKLLGLNIYEYVWHQLYSVVTFVVICLIMVSVVDIVNPILDIFITGTAYFVVTLIFLFIFPKIFSTTREELNFLVDRFKVKFLQ